MTLQYRVLVIEDDENALSGIVDLLTGGGYTVCGASTYEEGKRALARSTFDLLLTDVRLRGYNGLHLVMKVRAEQPDMAVIIMTGYHEPLLELEAGRYHAQFITKPILPATLLQAVARGLDGVRRERRHPRKRILGGFRVTAAGRQAAVMDVCYGGLKLEIAKVHALPARFAVEVSGIGLQLDVRPVWVAPAADKAGAIVCGAMLLSESSQAATTWRTIVDRLSA